MPEINYGEYFYPELIQVTDLALQNIPIAP
jgi:hypothetical protein